MLIVYNNLMPIMYEAILSGKIVFSRIWISVVLSLRIESKCLCLYQNLL